MPIAWVVPQARMKAPNIRNMRSRRAREDASLRWRADGEASTRRDAVSAEEWVREAPPSTDFAAIAKARIAKRRGSRWEGAAVGAGPGPNAHRSAGRSSSATIPPMTLSPADLDELRALLGADAVLASE